MDIPISAAFPFESRYIDVLGSRMHYIEEGSGAPILFLHGNPTSSYLWRNVIPHLSGLGRCIAVDLIGMGRSDKPPLEYRFVDHARYLDAFIAALDLRQITLVVHDWGSALGFHYAARNPNKVRAIAFMEAIMRPISWDEFPASARGMFQGFRTPGKGEELIFDRNAFVERVLPGSIMRQLSDEEMERYREPYRERESRRPTWRWPNEIPIDGQPADVTEIAAAYSQYLQTSPVPKLLLTATPGALIQESMVRWCREHLPNLTIVEIGPGSHFVQEDQPHRIGEAIAEWLRSLPAPD